MTIKIVYNGLRYEYHPDIDCWVSTGINDKTGQYVFTPGLVFNKDFIDKLNKIRDEKK